MANPMIGCRVQQTYKAMRGVNRWSREERQERNECGAWQLSIEGNDWFSDWTGLGVDAQSWSRWRGIFDNPKRGVTADAGWSSGSSSERTGETSWSWGRSQELVSHSETKTMKAVCRVACDSRQWLTGRTSKNRTAIGPMATQVQGGQAGKAKRPAARWWLAIKSWKALRWKKRCQRPWRSGQL